MQDDETGSGTWNKKSKPDAQSAQAQSAAHGNAAQSDADGLAAPSATGPRAERGMARLVEIMQRLRDPEHGCPWDQQQTWRSIVPHTLEEVYELIDTIERADTVDLKGELGDLLFQVVYYAQFAAEEGVFDLADVTETLAEKLIRRHPHVFGEVATRSMDVIKDNWERTKAEERAARAAARALPPSVLDDVPLTLPGTLRAAKLQRRAARVGFDFANVAEALAKLRSEVAELAAELPEGPAGSADGTQVVAPDAPTHGASPQNSPTQSGSPQNAPTRSGFKQSGFEQSGFEQRTPTQNASVCGSDELAGADLKAIEHEIGDVLFAAVNIARRAGVDPEQALRGVNRRFETRFRFIEARLAERGMAFAEASPGTLDDLWEAAKRAERGESPA